MISKERLEELIEQGATIWAVNFYNKDIEKLELNSNLDAVNAGEFMKYDIKQYYYFHYSFESLFETEEDARWELEMTATRTETLKLANYTDFENENGDKVFYHKGTTYELSLWWASDNTKIIRITWNGRDGFGCIFEKPLTKENYIEACKLCIKLFRGKEV